ncbi:LOW QUALITY PROTEIN: DENN domain-containing protein 5B-like [Limulus polyphemus]|uniref:LOW QUALITY PROTEIN: DENN domain-containing protein 5B-like n=1 Tax=Limulus polyphemus TaxID=6850 RepID=A0ABM1SJR4_LIMPO|nr:LOW QUALITY PROTEIN: DENN domain-containing protein 5B-like [Limulus polyphemus]
MNLGPKSFDKRFADYFVICGLDITSGLEPDQLSGDKLHCTPLDRPYRSKVLAHYPDNVPWNPFDEKAVGMLCHPRGLSFRTQKHTHGPLFHSFIITREDGTRTYGHTLTFYEEVRDRQICAAMQTLQAMHLTELSSSKTQAALVINDSGSSHSLPRSFKLGFRQHAAKDSLYDVIRDTLYVTKCICLITQLPIILACRRYLEGLYSFVASQEPPPLPLECYVYNILYEVPLPSPGRSLKFSCFGQSVMCQRPGAGELPLFEYSLQELFSTLGVVNVVQLFSCVLLENQVLLCSKEYHKLMLVAEGITTLLFPFSWQHVYVPILPASLQHFLDAPVPYIMGLQHSTEDRSQLCIPGEANLCFVDIDSLTMDVPEDTPKLPYTTNLIAEICDIFDTFGIPQPPEGIDRNLNQRGSHRQQHTRKLSWSFESGDSGMSSSGSSARSSYSSLAITHSHIFQQSEALQRVTAIARRTGVITSLQDLQKPKKHECERIKKSLASNEQQYVEDLKFNNAIREVFLNRFIQMFSSYDHFVIQPNQQDLEQWVSSRESMQNFDKTAFLSDQPEPHLPFLSRFIESQMFATLIDNKIRSHWEEPDSNLKVFDSRIKLIRENNRDSLIRAPCYEPCATFRDTEVVIDKRASAADIVAPSPRALEISPEVVSRRRHIAGHFPPLDVSVLNREPAYSRSKKRSNTQWKRRDRQMQLAEHLQLNIGQKERYIQEARSKSVRHPKLSDMSPAIIARTNWKFVEALLKECKMRTKRMLVEKMGQEAVELGHGEISITGLEENTIIASLCDLLERVWSHGLQSKQGKSALWSHLLSYLEVEECKSSGKPIDPNFLTPALAWCVLRKRIDFPAHPQNTRSFGLPEFFLSLKSGAFSTIASHLANIDISTLALEGDSPSRRENKDKRRPRTPDLPALKPLSISLVYDVKNVQAMTEIKTDIGYARAWVRLAMEKKLLSKHLKKLLSNQELLRSLYKRYAFLRCDDEKEQFLYHLLTLNAVDYKSFTNTFTSTVMPYRVIIFPSRKMSGSTTSANAWIIVSGTLGETRIIDLPKQSLEIVFQHKNLGILTTVRIGHDNTGISPKWMVEHVVVRNEITGHAYKFPCGRWLGKGVDDGSTERLLVGELVPADIDNEELAETCRTPPRCRSPSVPRRSSEPKLTVPEIQQILGDAVNNIVKYFYKSDKERGSLTILLCGELGLVYCLEQVFLYGFKATRFFRQVYLWDFFVKIRAYFGSILQEEQSTDSPVPWDSLEHVLLMRSYCQLVDKIDNVSHSVGKDGKFQVFICLAARDHLLHRMLLHIASSPITSSMYEEQSFLRDPTLVTFLVQILESLSEFTISLESSLTKGVES